MRRKRVSEKPRKKLFSKTNVLVAGTAAIPLLASGISADLNTRRGHQLEGLVTRSQVELLRERRSVKALWDQEPPFAAHEVTAAMTGLNKLLSSRYGRSIVRARINLERSPEMTELKLYHTELTFNPPVPEPLQPEVQKTIDDFFLERSNSINNNAEYRRIIAEMRAKFNAGQRRIRALEKTVASQRQSASEVRDQLRSEALTAGAWSSIPFLVVMGALGVKKIVRLFSRPR